MLYNIYELKTHLLALVRCVAVSRVLSHGRDQALSSRFALLCQGCLSMCRVHSLLTFLHVCVEEQIFPAICLSCENHIALCDYHASLTHWLHPLYVEVSLTDAHSPWCPGWCPSGWGSLLACWVLSAHRVRVSACLSYDWALSAHCMFGPCMPHTLFPFAVRVISQCTICTRSFSFYHKVVSLSSFPLSSHQECINVFLLPRYAYTQVSPLQGKRKLVLTWNCPQNCSECP